MRIIDETLAGEGIGRPILIGPTGKCLIRLESLFVEDSVKDLFASHSGFVLGLQLHIPGGDGNVWIHIERLPAPGVGKYIDMGKYIGNLPEQCSVRVKVQIVNLPKEAEDGYYLVYRAILDDLPNDRII